MQAHVGKAKITKAGNAFKDSAGSGLRQHGSKTGLCKAYVCGAVCARGDVVYVFCVGCGHHYAAGVEQDSGVWISWGLLVLCTRMLCRVCVRGRRRLVEGLWRSLCFAICRWCEQQSRKLP